MPIRADENTAEIMLKKNPRAAIRIRKEVN
jgi:hypothetical protein